jgi:CheY-like chemotaxis protein
MGSILLVEDETLIRMLLAEMVQELGHTVVAEARTINEAHALARSAEFDLAILDVNLGQHSVEPVAAIVEQRGVPIIFASGYNENRLPQGFIGRTVLRKPFHISQLAAAIAATSGASR